MKIDKIYNRAFFTINIKLRKASNSRDATPQEYINIIKRVHSKKVHKPSSPGKHCIIRYLLEKKNEHDELEYLYGKIAQFTFFENKSWFDIDTLDVDLEFKLRDGLFPDAAEADFIFDPYTHKFAFITKSSVSISPYPVKEFWEAALNEIKAEADFIHVDVVTSNDFTQKLSSSRQIRRLEIDLNYSNSGIGSLSKEIIDEDLKKSNAKNATLVMVSKTNESIDIENSDIVKGALELSQEDGEARAKIMDESGNIVDISTRHFVKKSFFPSNEVLLFDNFIQRVRQIWPRRDN